MPKSGWGASTRRLRRVPFDGTDPTLKERVAALKASRDRAVEALDYAKKSSGAPIEIDPVAVDRFTRLLREQLTSGDVAARKAYLSSMVDAIIVSEDKIRIVGSNDNIRFTFGPDGQPTPRVRKSVQEWCPGAESNHRHCDFQSHALPTELPGRAPREGPRPIERAVYSGLGAACPPGFAKRLRRARPSCAQDEAGLDGCG